MLQKKASLALQQGVVLFFALIALVAMSLAAVALIRSVDTNSQISGNLSFKQSTLTSADRGVESGIIWAAGYPGLLNADNPAFGYYSTSLAPAKALVDANGLVDSTDSGGNQITYIIQRMCMTTGAPTPVNCLYGPKSSNVPCDNSAGTPQSALCQQNPGPSYRITSRVVGPKNTISYIQAFVY